MTESPQSHGIRFEPLSVITAFQRTSNRSTSRMWVWRRNHGAGDAEKNTIVIEALDYGHY